MKIHNKSINILIYYWLLIILLLISLIIIVGGLTRLTDSGLSITKWELFSGILPPLSSDKWDIYFKSYKEIPEFELQNYSMNLLEFKFIFWWEYIHRLLGRLIGLIFIIPLVYFTLKNGINKNYKYYFIFLLICFQGFIGWFMVKSGLTDKTDVSHYRLSLHLGIAFIILCLTLWNYFKISKINISGKKIPFYLPNLFFFIIFVQIIIGAFVSGMDAGQIYNTWPSMNGNYFPDNSSVKELFKINVLNEPSLMQFIHRNIAYLTIIIFCSIIYIVFRNKNFCYLKKTIFLIFFILLTQVFLGILTVLYGTQILIASLHQIGSIFLISSSLYLFYKNTNIN